MERAEFVQTDVKVITNYQPHPHIILAFGPSEKTMGLFYSILQIIQQHTDFGHVWKNKVQINQFPETKRAMAASLSKLEISLTKALGIYSFQAIKLKRKPSYVCSKEVPVRRALGFS
jgi:hypothetical protein